MYDLVVVGGGIVGLAHALAARRRGLSVLVVDREARAIGASIRNFGFVTVTGQQRGIVHGRAMRSRDIWAEVAPKAGIEVNHRGLVLAARAPDVMDVLRDLMATEMGAGCELLDRTQAVDRFPVLQEDGLHGALWSGHELRVEPRLALPRLAAWLEQAQGVEFRWQTAVHGASGRHVDTSAGRIGAGAVVIAAGDWITDLFPAARDHYSLTRCKLHMLRLAPQGSGWTLPGAVMSDESVVRYAGYRERAGADPVVARIGNERPDLIANGIHLIVVQSADGSLVVGDSHHYDDTPDPFQPAEVDDLMLDLARQVLRLADDRVIERWTGVYAAAAGTMFVDRPEAGLRLVTVTSGTGMSTAFAIGEEVIDELFGSGREAVTI
ncbi:MAG: TIGR03364 family FAD-dependent oxidoreductase [Pseudomonadota bacterium]|nr:TIGR03364 family FAD-dependent oxidoreductase [Pseudomonadota bacterium]